MVVRKSISPDYVAGMERLVSVVQDLSLARDFDTVTRIVRHAARELSGADGATFVLREGDLCFYADEEAIGPLWKGCRFPMSACISGWVMLNRQEAFIEDIYSDSRIPIDVYRPTFVQSLAMFPIRKHSPIGAIGIYWARKTVIRPERIKLMQALSDATSVTLEKLKLYSELEQRVQNRTAELEKANEELEAFSYAASHDLRAPLRSLKGFAEALLEDYEKRLDDTGKDYLRRIHSSAVHMGQLIEDLLSLSQTSRAPLRMTQVDLSAIARGIVKELKASHPERSVAVKIADNAVATADEHLMQAVMENLLSNAWKFTSKRNQAEIEFGVSADQRGEFYFVRDNGSGFNMAHASKLFIPFNRLHTRSEFPGTGVGLATVQRILQRHNGSIWCEAAEDKGATFYFRLGTQAVQNEAGD